MYLKLIMYYDHNQVDNLLVETDRHLNTLAVLCYKFSLRFISFNDNLSIVFL